MTSAELLTNSERCERLAYWSPFWQAPKLHPTDILRRGITAGLVEQERRDISDVAGEKVMELCADRGIDSTFYDLYASGLHHATLADILVSHLRKPLEPFWEPAPEIPLLGSTWRSSAFITRAGTLRRIALTDYWNPEKAAAEANSYYSLGEVCAYDLPMTEIVICLGAHREGKRHSAWTKGLLHPKNHKLRFKKKTQKIAGFSDSWVPVWREDVDNISRETWLGAMAEDDVLRELCFPVEIPVPDKRRVEQVRDLMVRKLGRLQQQKMLPEPKLSVCFDRGRCPFVPCCHAIPERQPSVKLGYLES